MNKTKQYISGFAEILNIVGILLVFVSVWMSGWDVLRFFVTGVLLLAWGLATLKSQREKQKVKL